MNNITENRNSNPQVSIILPVLNEPHLPNLIQTLNQILTNQPYEIIIVTSDKKKPNSSSPYIPLLDNIKYFKSYGDSLERAILLGFSAAKGKKIIVMDADGSHPPELVNPMIEALDDYEMIVRSRFISGGSYHTTFFRYLVSYLFTKYAQLLGSTLTDPMSGFFGIQSQLLTKIRFKPYTWKVALEISNKLRPKTVEFPFDFENRKVGKSKSNWKIGLKLAWDILEGAL